tara:strand:- start:2877 stop:4007 length:1131 start_codon:yes stop_codon:yes gene_type:complete
MRCKKGFLAIEYVAGIILLLIGAALLFLVINQFTNVSIDREACKASVVSRASLPVAGKGYVPLNCRTEKICITGKFFGGKCDELKNAEGVETIRVGNNEAGLNQIQKIYAESITECWNMMGRGRVSLFAQSTVNYYGVGEIYPTCVVCSRIAIDRDSLDNVPFEDMNVREYMMRYAVPGKDMTYFDFMMGEGYMPVDVGDSVSIPDVKEVRIGEGEDERTGLESGEGDEGFVAKELEGDGRKIPETAVVFMQITAPSHLKVIASTAASVVGVAGVGAGVGGATVASVSFVPGVKQIAKKAGGAVVRAVVGVKLAIAAVVGLVYQQASVSYNRAVAASYCGSMEVGSDARDGCSSVRTLDYDLNSISEYCDVIEGYP